ncbi:MAG: UDP-N-acetylmuramate dehydrogenase [Oscillospiraceae bacterium]|nr:UDP-N-acetylmuramate dehydrogenase [Oscillospiraceae bacterium]MCI9550355.1 UDP-N-acetylmuramate dehydrogenase [Oscillospiraceae bacterium]
MNWNALYDRLRAGIPALELRRDEPMARHTTFQVGGPVPVMALPKDEGEAQTVLHIAAMEFGIRPFFMGKGSNLLVSDAGADLLVVKAYDGLGRLELLPGGEWPGYQTILAGSGVSLARLSNFALEHGLTGLEFAHGIPGSVGGGVYMNAGAYGGELGQVVSSVSAVGLPCEEDVRRYVNPQFSYRHSRFQEQDEFILRACFTLKPGNPAEIRAKMDDFAQRRREKQPLEYPSAGSTFKRPAPADGRPVYAAALIDQCGLKGLAVGGAQVSEKHAGFVINRGGASCRDILELIAQVRERVFRETGITLEPEVRCLGREGEGWNF